MTAPHQGVAAGLAGHPLPLHREVAPPVHLHWAQPQQGAVAGVDHRPPLPSWSVTSRCRMQHLSHGKCLANICLSVSLSLYLPLHPECLAARECHITCVT